MKKNCLYCYKELSDRDIDFHKSCSKKFFGTHEPPILNMNIDEIAKMASKNVINKIVVPGVQKKISLDISDDDNNKLTIVGLWGTFILKPPNDTYEQLPENESITMKLAELFGIETVPNSLIRLKSGELSYITKRIDRYRKSKLPMEDMAQLNDRLTEEKYMGSLEQIVKIIYKYSDFLGFDLLRFFDINLFSFLTGNADMHLKNFSIYYKNGKYRLTPFYDLLSTRLVIPEQHDSEEFALTMLGKKSNFKRENFIEFGINVGLNTVQIDNIFNKYKSKYNEAFKLIDDSFLNQDLKENYKNILRSRYDRLELL